MRISDWSSDVCSSDLMDHHESDLYVRSTSEASAIIAAYEASGGITNKSAFRSAVDGLPWLELPFHYEPHWARDAGLLSPDVDLSEWASIGTAGDYAVWSVGGSIYNVTASHAETPTRPGGYYPLDRHMPQNNLLLPAFGPLLTTHPPPPR